MVRADFDKNIYFVLITLQSKFQIMKQLKIINLVIQLKYFTLWSFDISITLINIWCFVCILKQTQFQENTLINFKSKQIILVKNLK